MLCVYRTTFRNRNAESNESSFEGGGQSQPSDYTQSQLTESQLTESQLRYTGTHSYYTIIIIIIILQKNYWH